MKTIWLSLQVSFNFRWQILVVGCHMFVLIYFRYASFFLSLNLRFPGRATTSCFFFIEIYLPYSPCFTSEFRDVYFYLFSSTCLLNISVLWSILKVFFKSYKAVLLSCLSWCLYCVIPRHFLLYFMTKQCIFYSYIMIWVKTHKRFCVIFIVMIHYWGIRIFSIVVFHRYSSGQMTSPVLYIDIMIPIPWNHNVHRHYDSSSLIYFQPLKYHVVAQEMSLFCIFA